MRTAVLTLLGSLALSAAAMPANAGPTLAKPGAPTVSNIIEVSGGCPWGYFRDFYGYCQPYTYAAYGTPAWHGNPHWHHGHHWHHRHHHHHHRHHGH
jgi:hypothetical protein